MPGLVWFLLVGLIVGSTLEVLVTRLPANQPVVLARSRCPSCDHRLHPLDLIPIVSWVGLRGRCRYCRTPIGLLPPALEIGAAMIAAWAWAAVEGGPLMVAAGCLYGWLLLTLAVIDSRTFHLPDSLTVVLGVSGLLLSAAQGPDILLDHAIGAGSGFLLFAGIAALYRVLRKREGLGFGDVKLLAAIGAWVSWQGLASVVLWAAFAGLAVVALQKMAGRRLDMSTALPFGPCLAAGGWIVWLYGPLAAG